VSADRRLTDRLVSVSGTRVKTCRADPRAVDRLADRGADLRRAPRSLSGSGAPRHSQRARTACRSVEGRLPFCWRAPPARRYGKGL